MAPPSRVKGTCRASPGLGLERDPVGDAVAVPGDDAGALAGVGRRQLLAHQGVEQRGLAGLDLAGDGDPQRLVEPVEHRLEPLPGRRARARVDCVRLLEQVAARWPSSVDLVPSAHGEPRRRRRPPVAGLERRAPARRPASRSTAMRFSSASTSRSRFWRLACVGLGPPAGRRRAPRWSTGAAPRPGRRRSRAAGAGCGAACRASPCPPRSCTSSVYLRRACRAWLRRIGELALLLVPQRLAAHEQADHRSRRDRPRAEAGHAAQHAEHEHAAVAALAARSGPGRRRPSCSSSMSVLASTVGRAPRLGLATSRSTDDRPRRPRRSARPPGRSGSSARAWRNV